MITNPVTPLEWEQYNNEQYQLKQNPVNAEQLVAPVAPAPASPYVSSMPRVNVNPSVTLKTPTGINSGLMPVNPYFQTTSPVQNQYSWAPRSEANPLQGGEQPWGVQQPNQGFNVDQFISEMLGPKAQAQTATLPTPYPGK